MNFRVIFFIIGITIVLMGSVLFFVVSSGAKNAQTAVLKNADDVTRESSSVTKGLFELGEPSFLSTNHSCSSDFVEETYITLIMSYQNTPRSCSVFVNERITGSYRNLRPDCRGECPYEDYSRTLFIDHLDVRDNHDVRVCCNDICVKKELDALCN